MMRSCIVLMVFGTATAAVFVEKQEADAVLSRWRRANSGFLEELKQGNLERECREEICDLEEAREVFEDDALTRQFWDTYERRDPCRINPCRNNGVCVTVESGFQCQCAEGFEGHFCQTGFEDSLKCNMQNGQCEHFCDGSGKYRKCSCADGYILGEDGRQCIAQVKFPCGQVAPVNQSMIGQLITGVKRPNNGESPWQVLIQLNGASHCGGALIRPDRVLTAAHCVHGIEPDKLAVVAGEQNLDADDGTEQRILVSIVITHEDYEPATGDNDIALLHLSGGVSLSRYAIPICLPTKDLAERELLLEPTHVVSGWGRRTSGGNEDVYSSTTASGEVLAFPVLRSKSVPIIEHFVCSQIVGFNITERILCAGYPAGLRESCLGDDGSPLTTLYGSTHFLTGVVAWGRGCSVRGYFGVYTNVAKFVDWVESKNLLLTAMSPDMLEEKDQHSPRQRFRL